MSNKLEIKEIEKAIESELETITVFESLVESKGYQLLKSMLQQQERLRRNEILLGQFHGLDGLIDRDKLVAELRGISTAMHFPSVMITESRMLIEGYRQQLTILEDGEKYDN